MTEAISKSKHKVKIVKNVMIPMRDGIHLAADLIMPDTEGRFPALIEYCPYRKDDLTLVENDIHYFFAERGYVDVRLDVRGTGSSEGYSTGEYSSDEIEDAQEAIYWLAKQKWCTGKVGMFGWSYSGQTSMIAAMNAPEPLKAISCAFFADDRYKADCHYVGGSVMPWVDHALYGPFMICNKTLPPYPEYSGEKWIELWRERLEKTQPWTLTWLEHRLDEKFWHSGSVSYYYDRVKAATFIIDGWRDGYPGPAIRMYENIKSPKRLLIGPWMHNRPDVGIPGPKIHIAHEMLRWWDYWLKGIETGVTKEPPISLYVQKFDKPAGTRDQTSGFWRYEKEWPIKRRQEKILYLHEGGRLSEEKQKSHESVKESYDYKPHVGVFGGVFSATPPHLLPIDQRWEEAYSLNYTTSPLEDDIEVTGFPKATLYVSSTAKIAAFVVRLSDVAPDGTSALVTKGVLNATRRDSFEKPEALSPGKDYELNIELGPTSWLFEKGHRIRASISSSDWPNMWPTPDQATNSIYFGASRTSRIILPIIPQRKEKVLEPEYLPPVSLPLPADTSRIPDDFSLTYDLYKKQITMRSTSHMLGHSVRLRDIGAEISLEMYSEAGISTENPADAHVKGMEKVRIKRRDHTIEAIGEDILTSTHDHFHLILNLDIKLDGLPYFSKNWTKVYDRKLA